MISIRAHILISTLSSVEFDRNTGHKAFISASVSANY